MHTPSSIKVNYQIFYLYINIFIGVFVMTKILSLRILPLTTEEMFLKNYQMNINYDISNKTSFGVFSVMK